MPYDRAVFLPDVHVPYQDDRAVGAALAFVREYQPSILVLLGDIIDFYQLSRFPKDSKLAARLPEDLESTRGFLRRVREAAPRSRLMALGGNHERRLQTYLRTQAPALSGLRGLNVHDQLDLKDLHCAYYPTGHMPLCNGSLMVKHGNVVRSKAGYTATAELERAWVSGISGHTHRLAVVYRRNVNGDFVWIEGGCLCDREAEYLEGATADWQHGLVAGELERGGNRFALQAMPIVNNRIVFGGKEIQGPRRR